MTGRTADASRTSRLASGRARGSTAPRCHAPRCHAPRRRARCMTCDMSLGFAEGVCQWLPNAAKIIDWFHVIKHANEAVDRVRKAEGRGNGLLKRTKCLWPRNESNLIELQLETKRSLQKQRLKTARACQMRETLQDIHDTGANGTGAETGLKRLCSWMMRSRWSP